MKFELELINIGRNNKTYKKEIETDDLDGAEGIALKEVKKWLMSSIVDLSQSKNDKTSYFVFVGGFRKVGEVKIKEIK
jgi:hypothetical protein